MKIKKIFINFLVVVLAMSLMTGCKASEKNKEDKVVDSEAYLSKETEKEPKDHNPVATIEMNNGDIIKLELYPEIAPNTVRNFIFLANSNFYNGTIFHRVIEGFMIQGGDPEGTGMGGPEYSIFGEFSKNGFENDLTHERGVISMARGNDKNSAGSQFFIVHQDSPHLNGDYAAFGKVIEGLDVVDKIATAKTGNNNKPKEDIIIKNISVDTFGVTYKDPIKYN